MYLLFPLGIKNYSLVYFAEIQNLLRRRQTRTEQFIAQLFIGNGKDLNGKQRRILCAVDRDGRHGDACGHLHRGQERIQPVQRGALDGNADDGQHGIGCQRTRKMRSLARRRDDRAVAILRRFLRKFACFNGRTMRRIHMYDIGHTILLEYRERLFDNGKIAVASHDDCHFFHCFASLTV